VYTDGRRGGLDQLHRRGRRIAPPVVLLVVQLVTVGRSGRGVVERDQHVATLNVDPDHVRALVQRGELHRRTRNRQALVRHRSAKRARRAGVYVVDIHHGREGLKVGRAGTYSSGSGSGIAILPERKAAGLTLGGYGIGAGLGGGPEIGPPGDPRGISGGK
jgi:hypothetical protein